MAESLGRAVFDLELNDSAFQAGLKRAEQGVRTYTDSAGRLRDQFGRYVKEQDAANQSLGRFNREAGNQAGVAGLGKAVAGLVAQLGLLAVAAKAFDQIKQADDAAAAVRTLGVNSVELGNNLQLVSASLRANVSTLELTKAAYDVASAGFADAAQATDVLKASALGAKGGFSTINTVADAATSVLNAYGLAAREAGRIVDGFITTQNDGKIVVDQYAAQIGKLAPIAAAAGVSISELNAAISAATAQGVPVEATFSGLRQVISSILKPTQEATELADRLGITFNAQALQAQGLGQFLQQVAAKTKGSADANAVLFGSVEALTAVQPLLNDQLVKYNQFLDNQRNSAGAAAAAASTVSETISSGITAIGNAFSNLLTSTNFSSIGVSLGGLAETINSISLTPAQQEFAAIEQAIAIVTQEIERRKEYGLDTSIADRRLAELERRANVVRQAVGEQTNVEALKAEAVQLGKQAEALKRSGLDAAALNTQLGAIGNEIAALEGRDITFNLPDGTQIAGFVNDALKGLGDELQNAEVKLNALQKQRTLAAPGVDTTQLDGDIATIESKISRIKGEIKIEAERTAIDKEIKRVQGLLNNPINFERFFVKGFGGPEAQKALKERLTGLQQEKQILEQVVNQNAKAAQEKQKGTANQQRTNEEAKAGAAQAAAAAVAAKQAEVAVRNEKLKTLNSERTLYKQQETRLGLYAQETQLVGQIAAARNQAALDRSNTIKSLLDQELQQAQGLATNDAQRRQLELQYGQRKFNQTVAEFDLKARALVTEQEAQQASLAFEQQKAAAAGKRAEIEAQIALIQAQQQNAEKGTPETQRQVELAQQNLDLIRQTNSEEQRLGGLRSELLDEQQAAARERLSQERLIALNGQAQYGTIEQQSQLQADVNEQLRQGAGYADAAAVSAQNFKNELNGAAEARGDLSTAFQAQVNTVIDGSQQFSQMNTYLSQIVTNTQKPPVVNVTVNNSGTGSGNSSRAVVSGTSS